MNKEKQKTAPGFILLDITTSSVILLLSAIMIWAGVNVMQVISNRIIQNIIVELEFRYDAMQMIYPELNYEI